MSPDKKTLRSGWIRTRDRLDTSYRKEHSIRISTELERWTRSNPVDIIHTFLPMRSEVDIIPFIQKCLNTSIRLYAPMTLGSGVLQHCILTDLDELEPGLFGTRHPKNCQPYQGTFSAILVPGLAFDQDGYRLGYGGGYYDRFLSGQPEATKIGICFPIQRTQHLPREAHDIAVDLVVC